MRFATVLSVLLIAFTASAAELESRVLTHYVPQDLLETAVRTEGWTEIALNVKGGVRKGDVVRIWAGGSIDRGNGDQPGENVVGPDASIDSFDLAFARLEVEKAELKQERAALDKAKAALKLVQSRNKIDVVKRLALSQKKEHAFALIFKTETSGIKKCMTPGKPLEIPTTKDKEKLWLGFNDEKGRYQDNHLGKGRRHELDPLWVRIEVVRITVD